MSKRGDECGFYDFFKNESNKKWCVKKCVYFVKLIDGCYVLFTRVALWAEQGEIYYYTHIHAMYFLNHSFVNFLQREKAKGVFKIKNSLDGVTSKR